MGNSFSAKQIPDLSGKTAIVTGANTGIGLSTCFYLAEKNARVILACRNEVKAKAAIDTIKNRLMSSGKSQAEVDTAKLEFLQLNLSDLNSCVKAAEDALAGNGIEKVKTLDILINNAGIMTTPYELTKQGVESQWGTNHLGHFVWTMLLLPVMSGKGRIVNLSSEGHRLSYGSELCTLQQVLPEAEETQEGQKKEAERIYSPVYAYGHSKLSNVLFSNWLARKRPNLFVMSLHPGIIATELGRSIGKTYGIIIQKIYDIFSPYVLKTADQGCITTLYAATSPDIEINNYSGKYLVPQGKLGSALSAAGDLKLQDKLWELSLEIVKRKLGNDMVNRIKKNAGVV
ncbi:hypothetical protein BKA69DRAFT_1036146 [Paraphysoderma sedebokerense]|nr:hypothetical protein BKA69DRAFT_1036146 [Paraphysoderma sedebokerense]